MLMLGSAYLRLDRLVILVVVYLTLINQSTYPMDLNNYGALSSVDYYRYPVPVDQAGQLLLAQLHRCIILPAVSSQSNIPLADMTTHKSM